MPRLTKKEREDIKSRERQRARHNFSRTVRAQMALLEVNRLREEATEIRRLIEATKGLVFKCLSPYHPVDFATEFDEHYHKLGEALAHTLEREADLMQVIDDLKAENKLLQERLEVSSSARDWLTAVDILALKVPGYPATRQGIQQRAEREQWPKEDVVSGGRRKTVYRRAGLPQDIRWALMSPMGIAPAG